MQCNKMVITFTDCFFNCQTSAKYVQLNLFSLEYVFHYDGYCLFCVILQRTLSHHLLYIFAKVARLCHKKRLPDFGSLIPLATYKRDCVPKFQQKKETGKQQPQSHFCSACFFRPAHGRLCTYERPSHHTI